jgi:hypothetical protein
MRIKKKKRNEFILAQDVWVRNPYTKSEPIDINDMIKDDISLFMQNEIDNLKVKSIDSDDLTNSIVKNAIICSDGYGWKERQKILASIPSKKAHIFGINGSLSKWELVGELSEKKRIMSAYLANNPYPECVSYLPKKHRYYPPLIVSTRANPEFVVNYLEKPTFYIPTKDLNYSGALRKGCFSLDDYRNPLCAAISYSIRMGVSKIVLFCCDEAFIENRPGSEKMKNGLYQYPQQIKSQKIVDAQFYWMKSKGVKIADCSSGIEYENAAYINAEDINSFF